MEQIVKKRRHLHILNIIFICSFLGSTNLYSATPEISAQKLNADDTSENEVRDVFERVDRDNLRNPFWPIGYEPSPEEEEIIPHQPRTVRPKKLVPQWNDAMKQLNIRGIMKLGSEYVATINGQIVKKGDIVALIYEGNRYRWRVKSITGKGKVSFKPVDVMTPPEEEIKENPEKTAQQAAPKLSAQ